MKINYLVQYYNPVGILVEDCITSYQFKRLLKRYPNLRWNYKLRIDHYYNVLTFVYSIGSFFKL